MTHDRWAQVVREQVGLGGLLPLGYPQDGTWLTESAAREALRRAADTLEGIRPGTLRITPLTPDADGAPRPGVPPPPTALPHGPLRIEAEFAAPAGQPIPQAAARLRDALWSAATAGLGLAVDEVNLRVTALLDDSPACGGTPGDDGAAGAEGGKPAGTDSEGTAGAGPEGTAGAGPDGTAGADRGRTAGAGADERRVAGAVRKVPGVTRLTGRLGGAGRPVHLGGRPGVGGDGGAALPARHLRVEIAVAHGRHPLEVARAVRRAATGVLADRPTIAVLITDLD